MDFLDELRIEHGDCDPDECETKMLLDVLDEMQQALTVARTERNQWRGYAAFCKSCALSGETPYSFENYCLKHLLQS